MNRELLLPTGRDLKGIVIFAHGSGSSARSPRNRYVAERLVEGASHLFSEAGTLEEAARITLEWLEGHMGDQAGP